MKTLLVEVLMITPQRPSAVKRIGPIPGSALTLPRISSLSGSMTVILPVSTSVTYTAWPSGENAIDIGRLPVSMSLTFSSVCTLMTVTVPLSRLVTNARLLSSVKTISWWPGPVGMNFTGTRSVVSMTVTPLVAASVVLLPTQR